MSRLTRDGTAEPARPNSQVRMRTEKMKCPCSADREQDWQPCPVDPYSCYMCDLTYILHGLLDRKISEEHLHSSNESIKQNQKHRSIF